MEAKDIDQNSKPLHRQSSKMKVRSILRPGWTLYGRTPLKWKSRNVGYVQIQDSQHCASTVQRVWDSGLWILVHDSCADLLCRVPVPG